MSLSIELKIPILVVAQSNRGGAREEAPDVEHIRDSDGIGYNASLILALKQKDNVMEINIRKNRNGRTGDKISYLVDLDKGIFKFNTSTDERIKNTEQFNDTEEIF